MYRNLFIFTLLFFTLCTGFNYAQKKKDKNNAPSTLEIRSNLIVLDKDNNFVQDLKKEDVKIFEDEVEQEINYFVQKPNTVSLGFVMDNSGSLRFRLDEITKGSFAVVETLNQKDEAFMVRFINSDKIQVIQEWTNDKRKLFNTLENMYIEGGQTAINDAVYLAAQKILERYKKHPAGRYALLLVSDGEDRTSYYKYEQVLSLLRDTDIQIFMVSFANEVPKKSKKRAISFSQQIALDTGGTSYILPKKAKNSDVLKVFKTIALELRSPYIFGYTPTNQKRDGKLRKLRVEITDSAEGKNRRGFIRSEFIVPKVK